MNKKVLFKAAIGFGLGLTVSLNAVASDLYGNASYLSTKTDTGISGLTGTAALDESGAGYKLTIGNKVSDNFSVEGFYADFGKASLSGNTGDTFTAGGNTYAFIVDAASFEVSATGFGVSAKLSENIGDNSSIFGQLGLLSWKQTLTIAGAGVDSGTASDSGSDVFYGLGYKYNVNEKFAVTANYDLYTFDGDDVTAFGIGASVAF
jgi:hypothetical protein